LFFTDVSRLPRAEVVRVVDGDTLKILWQGRTESLRYYGVNTPEKDEACFQEATERNRQLAGASVRLAFDERPKDRYGRLLAYVFSEEGKSIDAQLVSEGWGRAWKRDGRLRDQLIPLEQKARRARVGCLWTENNSRAENGKRKRRVRARREG
jgi:micrococcal nuclease